ncbi:hypothetical protein QJQ45_018604, partial [Haematococcus lacustris]
MHAGVRVLKAFPACHSPTSWRGGSNACTAEAEDASTSSSAPQQDDPDVVWYFAYGADMSWESLKRCNVRVASRDAAFVRDPRMRLVFRHRGGLPTLEPEPPSPPPAASSTPPPNSLQQRLSSSQQSSSTTSHPSSSGSSETPGSVSSRALSSPAGPWPIRHSSLPSRSAVTTLPSDPAQPAASLPSIPRVHGVLYRTTRAELRKMRQRDMGYMLQELEVETYGGRTVPALVFVSGPLAVLPHSVAPPESYISSMREGAAFNFIDPVYQVRPVQAGSGLRGIRSSIWRGRAMHGPPNVLQHRTHSTALPEAGDDKSTVSIFPASLVPVAEVVTEELRSGGSLGPGALEARRQLCDSGLPDVDMCEITEAAPAFPALAEAWVRRRWLLGLLALQSTSSFVLNAYQDLLRDHMVVTLFLTMLVGAGGNAGNQSAIKVIRGLATGSIKPSWQSARNTLQEQAAVGLLLGLGLGLGGFLRVYLTSGSLVHCLAISCSLFLIVLISVVLGSSMPFILCR